MISAEGSRSLGKNSPKHSCRFSVEGKWMVTNTAKKIFVETKKPAAIQEGLQAAYILAPTECILLQLTDEDAFGIQPTQGCITEFMSMSVYVG